MRATTTRDDSGQMMAALVIGLSMTLLAFLVVALVPIGAATNDKTRSQTAADAAALAAADELRRHWVGKVTEVGGLADPSNRDGLVSHPVAGGRALGLGVAGDGRSRAEQWARQNGSDLTGYEQLSRRDPVRVQVEVEVLESSLRDTRYAGTGRAASSATAEVDVPWDRCSWSPRPPEPTLELGGRPTYQATLTCGDFFVGVYEVHNSSALGFGFVRRITGGDVLLESVERPRLVD